MYEALTAKIKSQRVIVAGDGHYWPEKKAPAAHRCLVDFMGKWPVDLLVYNGDALDAANISKHPPKGWAERPSLLKQLNVTKKRMGEIQAASAHKTKFVYLLGNHEMRFDRKLATVAGQYKGIAGMALEEHFPHWTVGECLTLKGKEMCVIKHEMMGGTNPLKSNLQKAGCHIITGHHHSQNVLAFTDYQGTRYAVDHGMLGRPDDPQFDYGDSNPVNWRSGFVVLQWWEGKMLPPQLATVTNEKKGEVWFNGYMYKV